MIVPVTEDVLTAITFVTEWTGTPQKMFSVARKSKK